ncbi:hypothetical protein GQ53DRAFT_811728 [Thozetella sp. PMI_491]|nr:hypothetical protein GQ53DRAFT_811728 [Thozetella sp. PMI_491]
MAVHVAAHLQGLMFLTIRLMCIRDDNAEAASIASASADSGDNSTRKMASSDTQEKPDGSVASTNDMDPTSDKDGSEDEFSNNAVRKSAKVNWALDSYRGAFSGDLYAKSINEIPSVINNKLSFPPIPQTEECPYCGVIIEFKNRVKSAKLMLWQHLEPFICVFAHCLETNQYGTGPMTFETSKAWISHMQNAHGHVWEHSAPSSDPIIFDQETQYQEHSIKEYGMPKTHSEALDSAARRPVLEKVLECPFGDDFQPSENFESSSSGLFSSEALQLHVVAHMKEIALLTLQKLHVDGDEDSENVHSDLASKDNGLDFAPYRESMYSLLDEESLDYRDEESLDYQDDDAAAAQITQGHGEEETSAPVRILDKEDK